MLLSGASMRIPASEREAFTNAHDLLARASKEAEETAAGAEAARRQGWRDGLEAATAQAEALLAERLATLAGSFASEARARRAEIATAALAGVEAMLGTLRPEDAAVRLAHAAVARVPEDEQVVIACAPAIADRLRETLAAHREVTIDPREDFAPLQVTLHTGSGRVVADLDIQLAQLADRWGAA